MRLLRLTSPYCLVTCFLVGGMGSVAHAQTTIPEQATIREQTTIPEQTTTQEPDQAKLKADSGVEMVYLEHIQAETAQRIVETMFKGRATSIADPRSNSLFLRANSEDIAGVLEALREWDKQAAQAKDVGSNSGDDRESTYSFQAVEATKTINQLRAAYEDLDLQCQDLAQQLREQETPSKKPINDASRLRPLADLVAKAFAARQQLQRAEVSENARQLAKIQQSIEAREGLKEQIVQRRVDELLNVNLNWLKQESQESAKTPTPVNRLQSVNAPADATRDATTDANLLSGASELLKKSPTQLRQLLLQKKGNLQRVQQLSEELRQTIQREGSTDELAIRLRGYQQFTKEHEAELQFAKLQYDETLKYVEVAANSLKQQLVDAEQAYQSVNAMYKNGAASMTEVREALARPRELKVELQRLESLLKLYRAAGEVLEDTENVRVSKSPLTFKFKSPKLGAPRWIEGNGTLTTNSTGFWINSFGQAGTIARILFAKIPDAESSQLMLTFDTAVSLEETVKNQIASGRSTIGEASEPQTVQAVIDFEVSEEQIQAAIRGIPLRKEYMLTPELTIVEKPANDVSADAEQNPVIATIVLGRPSSPLSTKP